MQLRPRRTSQRPIGAALVPLLALLSLIGLALAVGRSEETATSVSVPTTPAWVAYSTATVVSSEGCDPSYGGAPPPVGPAGPCVGKEGGPSPTPGSGSPSGGPGGPSTGGPSPSGPSTPGPAGPSVPGPSGPSAPGPAGPFTGSGPGAPGPAGGPTTGGEGDPQTSPGAGSTPRTAPGGPTTPGPGPGRGKDPWPEAKRAQNGKASAFSLIPSAISTAAGDALARTSYGSVNGSNRGLVWGEVDATYPGVISASALVIGRRYYSRLPFSGVGSVGAGWVSSLYERIEEVDSAHVRHVDWNQPFNDPDLYFTGVEPSQTFFGPQPTIYTSQPQVGAKIVKNTNGTYSLTFRDGRVHGFDAHGRITSRSDFYGNTITFSYDTQGGLQSITDSRGQSFSVTVDQQGYLETITDPLGYTLTYTNQNGYLAEVEWHAAPVFEYAPNQESGTLVTRTTKQTYQHGTVSLLLEDIFDDAGESILHVDYEFGLPAVQSQVNAAGGTYTFSDNGWVVTEIDPNGFKSAFVRDSNGYVVEYRRYTANFLGNPARTTDPGAFRRWLFERSAGCGCGRIDSITEPDDGVVRFVYDAVWNIVEMRREEAGNPSNALVWSWGGYDVFGRAGWHIPPEGNAAQDPTPHKVTYSRVSDPSPTNPGGTLETVTIPARHWRTWASVWTTRRDSRGRKLEALAASPNLQDAGVYEKFEYWPAGGANSLMPKRRYERIDQSIYQDFEWNANGCLTKIRTHTGLEFTANYDPLNRMRAWNSPTLPDAQSYRHEWEYDAAGRVAQIRYRYWTGPPSMPGATSHWIRWNYAHDSAGRVTKIARDLDTAGNRSLEQFQYDDLGQLTGYTDPDGDVSTVQYDELDQPWVLREGVGTAAEGTRTVDYDTDGAVVEIVESFDSTRNVIESFEYDELDRNDAWQFGDKRYEYELNAKCTNAEVRVYGVEPSGTTLLEHQVLTYGDWHEYPTHVVRHVYDATGTNVLRSITTDVYRSSVGLPLVYTVNGSLFAQFEYESQGVPKRTVDSLGNSVAITYGTNGWVESQVVTHQVPGGPARQVTMIYEADLYGRHTKVTTKAAGEADVVRRYEYDSLDRPVTIIDESNNRHRREFRLDGALVKTIDIIEAGQNPIERTTTYGLYPSGLLASITDDRNQTVTFDYDSRGRIERETNADQSDWSYSYDRFGHLRTAVTPTGRTIAVTYDDFGRPDLRTITLPGQGTPAQSYAYDYAPGGWLRRVDKTEGGTTRYVEFTRDGEGRVLTEDQDGDVVAYARDSLGRVTDITAPSGYAVHYAYDDHHRITGVGIPQGGGYDWIATTAYFGAGTAIHARMLGDGTTTSVSREGFLRTSAIRALRADSSAVIDLAYGWDERSLPKYEHRIHDGVGDVYRFDGLGRLVDVVRDSTNPAGEWQNPGSTAHSIRQEFDLDDDHHRIQVITTPDGGAPTTVGYATDPERHHYTMVGSEVRSFSLDGNLLTHGNRTFEYDALDALIAVKDSGQPVATYSYDALGRRSSKTVGAVTTRYVYSGPSILLEYEKQGAGAEQLDAAHYQAGSVDDVVMSRRRDRADVDGDGQTGDFVDLYHHKNRLGSTLALTWLNSSGTAEIVETYEYAPYGEVEIFDQSGATVATSAVGNPFLFTGREYDAETGLYHYRARAYDPATGAFLQEDPLGLVDDLNPVAYVQANPLSFTDPFGTSGLGETVSEVIEFISNNADVLGGILIDAIPGLAGLLDVMSAVAGKDITGWLAGGGRGTPEALGWWGRITTAASAAISLAGAAVGLIMNFNKILDKIKKLVDRLRGAGRGGEKALCFVAGTLVAAVAGLVPIEELEVGDQVAAWADPEARVVDDRAASPTNPDAYERIDPAEWRTVHLVMPLADGAEFRATLLRPVPWLEQHEVEEGGSLALDMLELRKRGTARVVDIEPCPPIETVEPGHRIVTGTFVTTQGRVLDLHLEGSSEPIGTTATHPFWSLDRGTWVPAGCLAAGEQVALADGVGRIVGVAPREARATVFNVEVRRDHTYFVGERGAWVHNNHAARGGRGAISMDEAVERAARHVDGRGVIETSGRGRNFQFRHTATNASGQTETRIGRFDINPADPHVQRSGPHLNIETQINGRIVGNLHAPIDPRTIRPGDYP